MGAARKNIEDFTLLLQNCFREISATGAVSMDALSDAYARHVFDFLAAVVTAQDPVDRKKMAVMRDLIALAGYHPIPENLGASLTAAPGMLADPRLMTPPGYFEHLLVYDLKPGEHAVICSRLVLIILLLMGQEVLGLSHAEMVQSLDENVKRAYTIISEHICMIHDLLDQKGVPAFTFKNKPPAKSVEDVAPSSPEKSSPHPPAETSPAAPPAANPPAAPPTENLDQVMAELNELVGIPNVKQEVKSLCNLVRVRQMRVQVGLPVPPLSLHLVFTGNPGTGKTTVARLVARIFRVLGLLSKGHLTEVDRSALVAGYVGQTAIKVQDVITKSLGGVLFIDEAYSLVAGKGESDFGNEAVETLLKEMEDHRDDLIVIVAGYQGPMAEFLESNPGLRSRFNRFIHFEDYSPDELSEIFKRMAQKNGYFPTPEAFQQAATLFQKVCGNKSENFANARTVRNFFEKAITNHANRIVTIAKPTKEDISTLTPADLPSQVADET